MMSEGRRLFNLLVLRGHQNAEAHRTAEEETGRRHDDVDGHDEPVDKVVGQLVAIGARLKRLVKLHGRAVLVDPDVAADEPNDHEEGQK